MQAGRDTGGMRVEDRARSGTRRVMRTKWRMVEGGVAGVDLTFHLEGHAEPSGQGMSDSRKCCLLPREAKVPDSQSISQ